MTHAGKRWWYDAHDPFAPRAADETPVADEIRYQLGDRQLLAEVWGRIDEVVLGEKVEYEQREQIAEALRHCVVAAGWDLAVSKGLQEIESTLATRARSRGLKSDAPRTVDEIRALFAERDLFRILGTHYREGVKNISSERDAERRTISFVDLASLYLQFRPSRADGIRHEFKSKKELSRLGVLMGLMEQVELELPVTFELLKTDRAVRPALRRRLEAVPQLLRFWREQLREIPNELRRAGRGEEADIKKVAFRASWKQLATERTGKPLHRAGAALYEATFGLSCSERSFKDAVRKDKTRPVLKGAASYDGALATRRSKKSK